MATSVEFYQNIFELYDPLGMLLALPPDEEVIQEGAFGDDRIYISRQCFLSVDRRDFSRLREDFDSLRQRLFDRGSPIHRLGFTYCVSRQLIARCLSEIFLVLHEALLDERNSKTQTLLFCVVTIHILALPEGTYMGDGEYGHYEEARILEESAESASGFVACPASQEAISSLGKMSVVDSGDCIICLEGNSPMTESECTSTLCQHNSRWMHYEVAGDEPLVPTMLIFTPTGNGGLNTRWNRNN